MYNQELYLILLIILIINFKFGIIILILYIIYISLLFNINNKLILGKSSLINTFLTCREPTMNNPYANYILGENMNLKSCDNLNNNLKKDLFNGYNVYNNAINQTLNTSGNNILEQMRLLYGINNNKIYRQFYTTTITNYPNNNVNFINWLYKN